MLMTKRCKTQENTIRTLHIYICTSTYLHIQSSKARGVTENEQESNPIWLFYSFRGLWLLSQLSGVPRGHLKRQ